MKCYFLVRKDTFQQQVFPEGVCAVMEATHSQRPGTARSHPLRASKSRDRANAHPDFHVNLPRGIFHTPVSFPKTPALTGTRSITNNRGCDPGQLLSPHTSLHRRQRTPGTPQGWRTAVTALGDSSPHLSPSKHHEATPGETDPTVGGGRAGEAGSPHIPWTEAQPRAGCHHRARRPTNTTGRDRGCHSRVPSPAAERIGGVTSRGMPSHPGGSTPTPGGGVTREGGTGGRGAGGVSRGSGCPLTPGEARRPRCITGVGRGGGRSSPAPPSRPAAPGPRRPRPVPAGARASPRAPPRAPHADVRRVLARGRAGGGGEAPGSTYV